MGGGPGALLRAEPSGNPPDHLAHGVLESARGDGAARPETPLALGVADLDPEAPEPVCGCGSNRGTQRGQATAATTRASRVLLATGHLEGLATGYLEGRPEGRLTRRRGLPVAGTRGEIAPEVLRLAGTALEPEGYEPASEGVPLAAA